MIRLPLALILSLVVAGCGYTPLYGTATGGSDVVGELAAISIPEAHTRLEQIVRNDLLSAMRPAGTAAPDRYRLELILVRSRSTVIDKPEPATTRNSVNAAVTFTLYKGSKKVYGGKTFSQVSYDVVRQPFADLQAENNAAERAAHELSSDIRTRLASYFATR